ncbi:unnamed protein product, partial [Hapterophycus canaliculatus]
HSAFSSPNARLLADAKLVAQVRLVDMIQDQMVASLDEREAALTTRPNSLTWPEFARQALSALLLNWAEQDAIFGDTSGAPSQSQAAQGRAARKKHGKGGKLEPQHLSPACVWLDAQHDARHGERFIESITGNTDEPPVTTTKPVPAPVGKTPGADKEVGADEEEGGGGTVAGSGHLAKVEEPEIKAEVVVPASPWAGAAAKKKQQQQQQQQQLQQQLQKRKQQQAAVNGGGGGRAVGGGVGAGAVPPAVAAAGPLAGGPAASFSSPAPPPAAAEANLAEKAVTAAGEEGAETSAQAAGAVAAAVVTGASKQQKKGEQEEEEEEEEPDKSPTPPSSGGPSVAGQDDAEALTPARALLGSSARVAALAQAAEAAAKAAAAKAAAAAEAAKEAAAKDAAEAARKRKVEAAEAATRRETGGVLGEPAGAAEGLEEEEDTPENNPGPDAAVLRAIRLRLEQWREDNTKSVEQ